MTLPATNFPGLDPLLQSGVIAVVRLTEAVRLGPAARALAAGGVGAVEVTLTTPGAIDAIADLATDQKLAGCVIGAGTVLDESAARYVIGAGAAAVSVGSALASAALLAEGSAAELTARARSFVERVAEARRHRGKTP